MSEILVVRNEVGPCCTISTVNVLDRYALWGMEPPLKKYKSVKPYAIPDGIYSLKYTWSHRLQKNTWQVMDVPGFEGVRIHAGNKPIDTKGCLLLGRHAEIGKSEIENSREAVRMFESWLNPNTVYSIQYVTKERSK